MIHNNESRLMPPDTKRVNSITIIQASYTFVLYMFTNCNIIQINL